MTNPDAFGLRRTVEGLSFVRAWTDSRPAT